MQAIKKPIPITVEEFQPTAGLTMADVVIRRDGDNWQVYNGLHDSWINVQPGDYLNVTNPKGGDIYPIDRATFERTYDVVQS